MYTYINISIDTDIDMCDIYIIYVCVTYIIYIN